MIAENEGISIAYICAECGGFAYGLKNCLSIDTGTTFTCETCGGKTVVSLMSTKQYTGSHKMVENLAMLVRRLCVRLTKEDSVRKQAEGFLLRNDLQGSILRDVDLNDYDLELESSDETACGVAGRKHRMKRISARRCECIYPDCDAFYEG